MIQLGVPRDTKIALPEELNPPRVDYENSLASSSNCRGSGGDV